jgi:hypothetical protein
MQYSKVYRFIGLLLLGLVIPMIVFMGDPRSCHGQLPTRGVWKGESNKNNDIKSIENKVLGYPGKSRLAAKLATIGQRDQLVVLPSGTWTVEANLMVPRNVTLRVEPGAVIHVANGVTLTINGPFEALIRQVFLCDGNAKVIFGPTSVKEVYPQWWGARSDAKERAATTRAFQAAMDAYCRVFVPPGSYLVNDLQPRSNLEVYAPVARRALLIGADHVFLVPGAHYGQEVSLRNLMFKVENPTGWAIRKPDTSTYLDSWKIDSCWFLQSGEGSIYCNAFHWYLKNCYFGHDDKGNTSYKVAVSFGNPNPASRITPNCNKFDQCVFVLTREQAVRLYNGEDNKFNGCIFDTNHGRAVALYGTKATTFYSCHFEGNNKSSYDSEILLAVHGSGVGGLPLSTLFVGCYFSPSPSTKFVVNGGYPATFIDCYKAGGSLIWHSQEPQLGYQTYLSGIINLGDFFSHRATIKGRSSGDYRYTPFQIETEQNNQKTDYQIRQYHGRTSNNTPGDICGFPLADNHGYFLEARVLASKSSGANKHPAEVAGYIRRATVTVQNGKAILIGKVQDVFSSATNPGWGCTIHLYGNYAYIRVTGANDSTINWQATLIMQSIP